MTTPADIEAFRILREKIEAELQARAEAMAERHGYDVGVIGFHLSRYQFGSLSNNHEAADMRSVLYRAQDIALARREQALKAEFAALHDRMVGTLQAAE